jgi:hypothetical protein
MFFPSLATSENGRQNAEADQGHGSSAIRFKKEPAMALEIFRPVSPPRGSFLDLRENQRTCRLGSFEMSIQVVHVDEHAICVPARTPPDGVSETGTPVSATPA